MFLLQTTVVPGSETVSAASTAGTLVADVAAVGNDIANVVSDVNWAQPSWDLFIILFFIIIVFFYGMMLGRDRIIIILVSIYMALAVVSNAPFIDELRTDASGGFLVFRVLSFVGIFILLFFLLSRSQVMKSFAKIGPGSWWQILVFSIFHVGLLVSVTLTLLPPEATDSLAPITRSIFASDIGRFLWIIAPIFGIVILKGASEESKKY